jgi:serine/threonine-protein kinase RsbW
VVVPGFHTDRTLEISSKTELLSDVRRFVADAARDIGFADQDIANIELAVDEACTNIIKHAYRFSPAGRIRVTVSRQQSAGRGPRLVITILDNGRRFDRAAYHTPDMREYFRRLKPGGLGVLLMTKLMDEVNYDTETGTQNSIQLVKYLPS